VIKDDKRVGPRIVPRDGPAKLGDGDVFVRSAARVDSAIVDKQLVKQAMRSAQRPDETAIEKLALDDGCHRALSFMAGNELIVAKDEATRELMNAEAAKDLLEKKVAEVPVKQSRTVAILEHFESQMNRAHEFSNINQRIALALDHYEMNEPGSLSDYFGDIDQRQYSLQAARHRIQKQFDTNNKLSEKTVSAMQALSDFFNGRVDAIHQEGELASFGEGIVEEQFIAQLMAEDVNFAQQAHEQILEILQIFENGVKQCNHFSQQMSERFWKALATLDETQNALQLKKDAIERQGQMLETMDEELAKAKEKLLQSKVNAENLQKALMKQRAAAKMEKMASAAAAQQQAEEEAARIRQEKMREQEELLAQQKDYSFIQLGFGDEAAALISDLKSAQRTQKEMVEALTKLMDLLGTKEEELKAIQKDMSEQSRTMRQHIRQLHNENDSLQDKLKVLLSGQGGGGDSDDKMTAILEREEKERKKLQQLNAEHTKRLEEHHQKEIDKYKAKTKLVEDALRDLREEMALKAEEAAANQAASELEGQPEGSEGSKPASAAGSRPSTKGGQGSTSAVEEALNQQIAELTAKLEEAEMKAMMASDVEEDLRNRITDLETVITDLETSGGNRNAIGSREGNDVACGRSTGMNSRSLSRSTSRPGSRGASRPESRASNRSSRPASRMSSKTDEQIESMNDSELRAELQQMRDALNEFVAEVQERVTANFQDLNDFMEQEEAEETEPPEQIDEICAHVIDLLYATADKQGNLGSELSEWRSTASKVTDAYKLLREECRLEDQVKAQEEAFVDPAKLDDDTKKTLELVRMALANAAKGGASAEELEEAKREATLAKEALSKMEGRLGVEAKEFAAVELLGASPREAEERQKRQEALKNKMLAAAARVGGKPSAWDRVLELVKQAPAQDISLATEEPDELKEDVQQLVSQVRHLRFQLKQQKEENRDLSATNKSLEMAKQDLENLKAVMATDAVDDATALLLKECHQLNERVVELEYDVQNYKSKAKLATEQLKENKAELAQLQKSQQNKTLAISSLKTEMEASKMQSQMELRLAAAKVIEANNKMKQTANVVEPNNEKVPAKSQSTAVKQPSQTGTAETVNVDEDEEDEEMKSAIELIHADFDEYRVSQEKEKRLLQKRIKLMESGKLKVSDFIDGEEGDLSDSDSDDGERAAAELAEREKELAGLVKRPPGKRFRNPFKRDLESEFYTKLEGCMSAIDVGVLPEHVKAMLHELFGSCAKLVDAIQDFQRNIQEDETEMDIKRRIESVRKTQVTTTTQLAVLTLLEDIHTISTAEINYSRTQELMHLNPSQLKQNLDNFKRKRKLKITLEMLQLDEAHRLSHLLSHLERMDEADPNSAPLKRIAKEHRSACNKFEERKKSIIEEREHNLELVLGGFGRVINSKVMFQWGSLMPTVQQSVVTSTVSSYRKPGSMDDYSAFGPFKPGRTSPEGAWKRMSEAEEMAALDPEPSPHIGVSPLSHMILNRTQGGGKAPGHRFKGSNFRRQPLPPLASMDNARSASTNPNQHRAISRNTGSAGGFLSMNQEPPQQRASSN
jgi:hypothetical protein